MRKKNTKSLIELLIQSGGLKRIKRTGWALKGIDDAESVADHTWRMGLMIMLLAPKGLDMQKLLEMNTVHDLGEIGVGDIKWEAGRRVIGDQRVKQRDEIASVMRIFDGHAEGKKYISLLKEFNNQKTLEAKFLKQIDKLEMAIQAYEYQIGGHPGYKLDQFWENAEKYLEGRELEPVFRELQKLRNKEG